jgi:hypothetical protein
MQQEFQKGRHALLGADPASFAPLLDLMSQVSEPSLQGRDAAGVAQCLPPFVQFTLNTFEFLAQPVQPLPKLSSAGALLLVVIVV